MRMREETNNMLKRGVEIHFAALIISIGLLRYGVTIDGLMINILPISPAYRLALHLRRAAQRTASEASACYAARQVSELQFAMTNRFQLPRIAYCIFPQFPSGQ